MPDEQPAIDEQVIADEAIRAEGDPAGPPVVVFDAGRGRHFHLDPRRARVYHECPEGFAYDAEGVLHPVIEAAVGEAQAEAGPEDAAPVDVAEDVAVEPLVEVEPDPEPESAADEAPKEHASRHRSHARARTAEREN